MQETEKGISIRYGLQKKHLGKMKSSSIFLTLLKLNTSSNEPVIIKVALKPFNIFTLSLEKKPFKLNCN